jgi:Spy/CpxP family protein refolding chaperone
MKLIAAIVALAAGTAAATAAPRNTDPDWPCQQVKVAELSVAAFWSGPAVDPATSGWQKNDAVASLVAAVTQRRLPMEAATQRISAFARNEDRDRTMPLVFAGVFDVLNREREKVINGLDRFGQRQKTLAEGLRQDAEALRAAQTANPPDDAKIGELTQHLLWDQQLFDSRRQSLTAACDLPTIIEQRLYGLAQAIQAHID